MIRISALLFACLFLSACPASSTPDAGFTCPVQTGTGTTHSSTITADETWKAVDGPHIVTFGINVDKGATLTIEPCSEVRLKKGYSIVVDGNLVAEGTATTPIGFIADDASQPWGYLQVFGPGTIKLANAVVSGGGAPDINSYAMIEARGDQLLPSQEILKLDHVAVTGSGSYGISLRGGAAFTKDSKEVAVTGSAKAAMRILPRLATNIPTGSYTGNTEDAIVVETEAYGEVNYEDVTFHDRGVPYRVGADFTSGTFKVGPAHFKLTLEAGVKFTFKKDGYLEAASATSPDSTGVIVATGTAAKPVVFTSSAATPAPGDWVGIQFGKVADAAFKLDHVEIRYAGGASFANGFHCQPNPTSTGEQSHNEDSALAIYHQPAGALLTNSLIADSKADGVDLAYRGDPVDHVATNTFTNVPGCKVTYPLPKVGLCPASVPCP